MKTPDVILGRARNVFFSQWEEMLRLRLIVLKSCEREDIHDLRVASRRFRAALNLLSPFCNVEKASKVSKAVRKLTRILGNLRNIDEALAFFGSRAGQTGLSCLLSRLADKREREQRQVMKALKGFKAEKLDLLTREIVAGITVDNSRTLNLPPLPSHLSTTSITLFESIHSLLPAALIVENSEERHSLRIAIKKWRYFLEIVSRISEQDYDTPLEQLKKYQSLLGSMNDMTEFGFICRESGCASEDSISTGQLLLLENERLYNEFVALIESEPLNYIFLI